MKIAVARSALAATKTIYKSDSKRYLSIMPGTGFQSISYWRGRGVTSDNIFGTGSSSRKEGYSASCIPCDISFSGRSTKVTVTASMYVSSQTIRTFRWAIIPYDFDWEFTGTGLASNDLILNQGKFTLDHAWGRVHEETVTMPVSGLPSGQFYIYWWRDSTSYGNVHVSSNYTVSVYTETEEVDWREATPYLWDGSAWKRVTPYVLRRDPDSREKEWARAQ